MHTALMEASMDGHVDVARLLLDHGAQVLYIHTYIKTNSDYSVIIFCSFAFFVGEHASG